MSDQADGLRKWVKARGSSLAREGGNGGSPAAGVEPRQNRWTIHQPHQLSLNVMEAGICPACAAREKVAAEREVEM